jgi:superfamily II DNA or RNA helicase
VHRQSLAEQAVQQFKRFTNKSVQLEMKAHGRGRTHRGDAQIVVASIHSLRGRRGRYGKGEFDFIGTDESHRFAGNTWAEIISYFQPRYRIGYTATPMRHDGVQLIGPDCEFQSIAFNYPLEQGVADGWLVPFDWRIERCRDIDLDSLDRNGDDISPSSVDKHLSRDPVVAHVVKKMIAVAGDRQGIVFCAGVSQVMAYHREFLRQGATAEFIVGETFDGVRERRDEAFKTGRSQFMIGCEIFIEGYDHPGIAVIGMAALTMSLTRYLQMIGRGSRTIGEPVGETADERRAWIAASEKPGCTILDFVGHSKRLNLICGLHAMGGVFTPEEVEEAVRLVADQGASFDINRIATQARENVARRPKCQSGGTFHFNDTAAERRFCFDNYADPFEVLGLDRKEPAKVVPEEETYGRPYQAARDFLVESKLTEQEIIELSSHEVVYLRDELKRRATEGLCTYPQARRLFNLGYDCRSLSYRAARQKVIDAKAAGWLRPVQDGPNERFLNR